MELVSLSKFVDFALLSGAPRFTEVKGHKLPPFDLYEPLKIAIVEVLRSGRPVDDLDAVMLSARDEKEKRLWPPLLAGLKTFLRMHPAPWIAPPVVDYPIAPGFAGRFSVRVNPEIGFAYEGAPTFCKLHLRTAPLTAKRVSLLVSMMRDALGPVAPTGATFGVLDVRAGKLHTCAQAAVLDRASAVLRADGVAYAALWGEA